MTSSKTLYEKACQVLVGGVNSPVRSFNHVGGTPLFFEKSDGPFLVDVEGRRYIDFVLSWGPLILGHRSQFVVEAIQDVLNKGWTFGAPVQAEIELAQEVLLRHPSLEKIRFVNSGTEATLSALRLARAVTNREHIVKFAGCYHGHVDNLLVQAGSGLATAGRPSSAGIPDAVASSTLVLPYNDPQALTDCFEKQGSKIATVIVEPVAGNMGVIPPLPEFVEVLNHLSQKFGSLLIIDEVMTGFRVGYQSAFNRFSYEPDLVTFGKVIGGGFPVGAYAGRSELMNQIEPLGPVYQAGTLSGNPLAMAAGLATLQQLTPTVYRNLENQGKYFSQALTKKFIEHGIPHVIHQVGSMLSIFFTSSPVQDFNSAKTTNENFYQRFFHACLDHGLYLPPSAYESLFLSTEHDERILDQALDSIDQALEFVKNSGLSANS